MNDVRMEATSSSMFNIRRAAFVIKSLGKDYYPEAVLGNIPPLCADRQFKKWNQCSVKESIIILPINQVEHGGRILY